MGEILRPGRPMVTVGERVTPDELERTAAASGFSRLPVTGARRQRPGLPAHQGHPGRRRAGPPLPPRGACTPSSGVRPTTPLDDTLTALRAAGTHLAAVTGDDGALLGFVTMEDVLEELVGPATEVEEAAA